MTGSGTAGLPAVAERALHASCAQAGLDVSGARLIRMYASAVYLLPAEHAVARVACASERKVTALSASIRATRWLHDIGYPTVVPLDLGQPIVTGPCLTTIWHYLPQPSTQPGHQQLAPLLRRLHTLTPPADLSLPRWQPLASIRAAIAASTVITPDTRRWLEARCDALAPAIEHLEYRLPAGLIHGDAYRGNLLWTSPASPASPADTNAAVVLCDWDDVSIGPREIDLLPTLHTTRFGATAGELDAFVTAYGTDVRSWNGYPCLFELRDLQSLTALLRDAATREMVSELEKRIASIRNPAVKNRWNPY